MIRLRRIPRVGDIIYRQMQHNYALEAIYVLLKKVGKEKGNEKTTYTFLSIKYDKSTHRKEIEMDAYYPDIHPTIF